MLRRLRCLLSRLGGAARPARATSFSASAHESAGGRRAEARSSPSWETPSPETEQENALEISPDAFKAARSEGDGIVIIDVRESFEVASGIIEGARHIPLGALSARAHEIPRDKLIVVYCAHGIRSLQGAHFLRSQGLSEAKSLSGGIAAWSREGGEIVPFKQEG